MSIPLVPKFRAVGKIQQNEYDHFHIILSPGSSQKHSWESFVKVSIAKQ